MLFAMAYGDRFIPAKPFASSFVGAELVEGEATAFAFVEAIAGDAVPDTDVPFKPTNSDAMLPISPVFCGTRADCGPVVSDDGGPCCPAFQAPAPSP